MRGPRILLAPVLLALALSSSVAFAGKWKAGDKVDVLWRKQWYPAKILEVRCDLYKITYENWGSEWDEWVEPNRIRSRLAEAEIPKPSRFKRGDAVDVKWEGLWYAASVLEARGDKYLIHYDGHGKEWDEWVGPDRIRERTLKSPRRTK